LPEIVSWYKQSANHLMHRLGRATHDI